MITSYSAVSVRALRHPSVVDHLREKFELTLRGKPTYNWRFIAAGDVWYGEGDDVVIAPYDMAEIGAVLA